MDNLKLSESTHHRADVERDDRLYLSADGEDWHTTPADLEALISPRLDNADGVAGAASKVSVLTFAGGKIVDIMVVDISIAQSQVTDLTETLAAINATIDALAVADIGGLQAALDAKLDTTQVGAAGGAASLDMTGKVPLAQIPASLFGKLDYQGTWNAATNTPALASGVGTKGAYYKVGVAGATDLDGITDWKVNDVAAFNGATWDKFDNTDQVASVFGRQGNVVAQAGDYTATQITNTPAGSIAAVTVQAAINELDGDVTAEAAARAAADALKLDANLGLSGAEEINAAGTLQSDATPITKSKVAIIGGPGNGGVLLPAAVAGLSVWIFNKTASTMRIWAAGTDTIDTGGAGSFIAANANSQSGRSYYLECTVNGNWRSSQNIVLSGTAPVAMQATASAGSSANPSRQDHVHPSDDQAGNLSAAGTTQGTATAITATISNVTPADTNNRGVILPAATVGKRRRIVNTSTSFAVNVYPASGETIDGQSANVADSVPSVGGGAKIIVEYFCVVAGAWEVFRAVRWNNSAMLAAAATGSGGSLSLVSRSDHVHPSDVDSSDVAAAGATQGTATAITTTQATIATCTVGSAEGVILPAATAGKRRVVINRSGQVAKVYPATGENFQGQAANSSISLGSSVGASLGLIECWCTQAGVWQYARPIVTTGSAPANNAATAAVGNSNDAARGNHVHSTDRDLGTLSATGTTQGAAAAITATDTYVTTPDASNVAVILPAATVGKRRKIAVNGTQNLSVFPASGETIDGGSVNTARTVFASTGAKCIVEFECFVAGAWETFASARLSGTVPSGAGATGTAGSSGAVARLDHRHLSDEETASISAAGTTQGTATAITTTVVAATPTAGADGVVLPAATVGRRRRVFNMSATVNLKVYPASGETIDGGASANAPATVTAVASGSTKKPIEFQCLVAGTWEQFKAA